MEIKSIVTAVKGLPVMGSVTEVERGKLAMIKALPIYMKAEPVQAKDGWITWKLYNMKPLSRGQLKAFDELLVALKPFAAVVSPEYKTYISAIYYGAEARPKISWKK